MSEWSRPWYAPTDPMPKPRPLKPAAEDSTPSFFPSDFEKGYHPADTGYGAGDSDLHPMDPRAYNLGLPQPIQHPTTHQPPHPLQPAQHHSHQPQPAAQPQNAAPQAPQPPQAPAPKTPTQPNPKKRRAPGAAKAAANASGGTAEAGAAGSPPKRSRTNTAWTQQEEQLLKQMRDQGATWSEIAKHFPSRTEGSVKKHWYKDMHWAEFGEEESQQLLAAIKEYDANKWKVIGQKLGKPAKACEAYAKEKFAGKI